MVMYRMAPRENEGSMTKLARGVGIPGGLPDTYGMKAQDLARLMNQWRERALLREARDEAGFEGER